MSVYTLTYNGITLPFSHIDVFEQAPEYSDDGVDVLYIHTTITGRGLLNQCINNNNAGNVTNAAYLQTLRNSLLVPRQDLTFFIDGIPVIQQIGADAKNGPTPSNMKFVQIVGNTILVDFTIETWQLSCPNSNTSGATGPGTPANPTISNRWSQSSEIDANGLTTLTTTGTLIVSSSSGVNPDTLREVIFPVGKLATGFTRERQEYTVSPDGTIYEYTIVDTEKYRPPTDDITTWSGTWSESGTNGAFITGTLNITIQAKKSVCKSDMFTFLGKMIRSRIYRYDIPQSFTITEGLSDNTLNFTMTVFCLTNKAVAQLLNQDNKIILPNLLVPNEDGTNQQITRIGGTVAPIDGAAPVSSTTIGTRECYRTNLIINRINGVCEDKNQNVNYTTDTSIAPAFYGTACTVCVAPVATPNTSSVTATATIGSPNAVNPYTKYQIERNYKESHNKLEMPQGEFSIGNGENLASKIINTGAASTIQTVKFFLQRLNALPVVPSPSIKGQNQVTILKSSVTMNDPIVLPSGSDFIYTCYGEFEFIQPQSQDIAQGGGGAPNQLQVPSNPVLDLNKVPPAPFNNLLFQDVFV